MLKSITLLLLWGALMEPAIIAQNNSLIPQDLKLNFWKNPQNVDVENPTFSWTTESFDKRRRGIKQIAYQLIVSSSINQLSQNKADMWNSGKTSSDKMAQVLYEGKTLISNQKYWWKVKIWDEDNKASAWSKPAHWTMGILNKNEWKAEWISALGAEKYAPEVLQPRSDFKNSRRSPTVWDKMPQPGDLNFSSMLLRKEIQIEPMLSRAVVHVCGLGHYEMTINGKKVGNSLLTPGWTDYRKTVIYNTYDVTHLLKKDKNTIGLILSNGMYNIQPDSIRFVKFLNTYGPLKAIVQLHLEYADGSIKTVGTDSTWQVSPGPVTYMNQFGGEDYDARLVEKGWDKSNFTLSNRWTSAIEIPAPEGTL
jgi:alpha-L-rhamnosidase